MRHSSMKDQQRKQEHMEYIKATKKEFVENVGFARTLSEKLFETKDPDVVLELMIRLPSPQENDKEGTEETIDELMAAAETAKELFANDAQTLPSQAVIDFAMRTFQVYDLLFDDGDED